MLLGLLMTGMILGALAAVGWVVAGGSILGALALYAGAGAVSILAVAAVAFLLSELRISPETAVAEAAHPAE